MGDWPDIQISDREVGHIAAFFQIPEPEARRRLDAYRLADFANAWRQANPKTEVEIRKFYEETELYIWELTNWQSSADFKFYRDNLHSLEAIAPVRTHRRFLDYGSGVGTVASLMAAQGYEVTIADVPGKTFEYAQFRLKREGHRFTAIPITSAEPPTLGGFDLITCFDVLEHVPQPERVVRVLANCLRTNGVASIFAAFYDPQGHHPHHLEENIRQFGNKKVWAMLLESHGLVTIGPHIYRKRNLLVSLPRRFRYRFWRQTGFYLRNPVAKLKVP